MKIAIIGSHAWPINDVAQKPYSGDFFVALLCKTLDEFGHTVYFVAAHGSYIPPHGAQLPMRCAFGAYPPSSYECEVEALEKHFDILKDVDMICDFSNSKAIAESMYRKGYTNIVSSILGGPCSHPNPPYNVVAQSAAQAERLILGHHDYIGTKTPEQGGPTISPVSSDIRYIHGGIDTDFYTPTYTKGDFFLWLSRWHETRGYHFVIELAKKSGINLMMVGTHPASLIYEHEKRCHREVLKLVANCSNIKIEYLPQDENHHVAKRMFYRRAKAFLYPVQFQEPFGFGQIESLACGTPVIATNYGSMPEILNPGKCGIVVDNDVDAFIAATKQINKIDPEICRFVAQNFFDRRIMAANYLRLFEEVRNGAKW